MSKPKDFSGIRYRVHCKSGNILQAVQVSDMDTVAD